jgi:hypothetical protein
MFIWRVSFLVTRQKAAPVVYPDPPRYQRQFPPMQPDAGEAKKKPLADLGGSRMILSQF